MKVRDSGMPEQDYWETLFDPVAAVAAFSWESHRSRDSRMLELGCGYGTFTVELARHFTGHLDAIDINPEMVEITRRRVSDANLKNVSVYEGDFVSGSVVDSLFEYDVVILFHIMHLERPVELIRQLMSRARDGATFAFLHWRADRRTPRGPDLRTRPTYTDYQDWALATGLSSPVEVPLINCPHHHAVACRKPEFQ